MIHTIYNKQFLFEPHHANTGLNMPYEASVAPDQPSQLRRLVRSYPSSITGGKHVAMIFISKNISLKENKRCL